MSNDAIINSRELLQPVARFELTSQVGSDWSCDNPRSMDSNMPEFVGSFECLKQLLRLLEAEEQPRQPTGLTIHKMGNCIVLDHAVSSGQEPISGNEVDGQYDLDDELVLLPTALVEELCACLPRSTALRDVSVKNTFIHIPESESAVIPRYHSAPPGGVHDVSPLQVSPPRAIRDSVMTGLMRLPPSAPTGELRLPFLDPDQSSHVSRMNRAVEWNIAGFSVLLGCDVVVMDPSDRILPSELSAVKLLARDECWPSKAAARQAWLESSLLQVDRVAWVCPAKNSVELVTSTAELSIEADIEGMVHSIQRVLQFLHTECKGQGSTYCLVRESDGCCLLYDVSDLPKECDVLQVSPELAVPIAKVCFSLSHAATSQDDKQKLLRKSWALAKETNEADLCALVALELNPADVSALISALEMNKDWTAHTMQKLLVLAATAIHRSNPSLAFTMLAHGMLTKVAKDRLEVECKNLQIGLENTISRGLMSIRSVDEFEALQTSLTVLPLQDRVPLISVPSLRSERLQLALQLGSSDTMTTGVCKNELGSELLMSSPKEAVSNLIDSLEAFAAAEKSNQSDMRSMYMAVLMNLSRAFKRMSLDNVFSARSVLNRVRAIVFVRLAHRFNRESVPESIVGTELANLGEELVHALTQGMPEFANCEDSLTGSIERVNAVILSSCVLAKGLKSVENRSLCKISLSDFSIRAADVVHIGIGALARETLEMSLIFTSPSERPRRRAEVDFWITKLLAETGNSGKESLRHVKRAKIWFECNAEPEWVIQCICLQATVEYMLGQSDFAIRNLLDHHHNPTVRDCLSAICMRDVKSDRPHKQSKRILEAILRNQDLTSFKM